MKSEVLVVLINYARPQNMPAVIDAWNRQTHQCRVMVVDNALKPLTETMFPERTVSDYWRVLKNHYCPVRWLPAIIDTTAEYVIFADDDLLPTPECASLMVGKAEELMGSFATLGAMGRRFNGLKYSTSWRPTKAFEWCDTTGRLVLVKRQDVLKGLRMRDALLTKHAGDETVRQLVTQHDDILLSCGVQFATGYVSYKMDSNPLVESELPTGPEAFHRRPGHWDERNEMVKLVRGAGWRSLESDGAES